MDLGAVERHAEPTLIFDHIDAVASHSRVPKLETLQPEGERVNDDLAGLRLDACGVFDEQVGNPGVLVIVDPPVESIPR